ncbi:MAG TPA: thioredoxin family protein [Azospirillum sp.]
MLKLLRLVAAAALLVSGAVARADEPRYDLGGLHHEDWFLMSLLVLGEDHADAAAAGKRLAIVWEQKGCIYCRDMHDKHLKDPRIAGFVRQHFAMLQLDLRGDRMVTDFDGQVLSEKELARKHRVNLTPTIQFLPESALDLKGKRVADVEVARMPGLLNPGHFLAMFEFVQGRHYEKPMDFDGYLAIRPK